jgi:hypothetical protein
MKHKRNMAGGANAGQSVFMFGGCPDVSMSTAEKYCLASDVWEELPALPYEINNGCACHLNGIIYVGRYAGDLMLYDIAKNTVKALPFKSPASSGHLSIQIIDSSVYFLRAG